MNELNLTTPSLLFSAISLILLAYTNRFLSYASVIRTLNEKYQENPDKDPTTLNQIRNFVTRLKLIRAMQSLGALSLLLCLSSMFFYFIQQRLVAEIIFGAGMLALACSLVLCIWEIQISTSAISLHLQNIRRRQREQDATLGSSFRRNAVRREGETLGEQNSRKNQERQRKEKQEREERKQKERAEQQPAAQPEPVKTQAETKQPTRERREPRTARAIAPLETKSKAETGSTTTDEPSNPRQGQSERRVRTERQPRLERQPKAEQVVPQTELESSTAVKATSQPKQSTLPARRMESVSKPAEVKSEAKLELKSEPKSAPQAEVASASATPEVVASSESPKRERKIFAHRKAKEANPEVETPAEENTRKSRYQQRQLERRGAGAASEDKSAAV